MNLSYLAGAPASEKGNELTKFLCGPTGLRGLFAEATTDTSDLRRKMHCAAFNAIAALLMATQDQEKFFAGFLFKETPAKGERPLDNLVDAARCACGVVLKFGMVVVRFKEAWLLETSAI